MAFASERPRRHSLSDTEDCPRPHYGNFTDVARRATPRRARLPRSRSTGNLMESFIADAEGEPEGDQEDEMRDVAREQIDRESLLALAEFFRNTAPPPPRQIQSHDCFGRTASAEPRRWSIQSLRKNKKGRFRPHSLQLRLPDSAVPGTTAEGNRYIAISIPIPQNAKGPWFRSQYPVFGSSPLSRDQQWPERTSSRGALGPSSPTTESASTQGSARTTWEVAVAPSRSSTSSYSNSEYDRQSLDRHSSTRTSLTLNSGAGEKTYLNPVDEGHESQEDGGQQQDDTRRPEGTWFSDSDDERRNSQVNATIRIPSIARHSPMPSLSGVSPEPSVISTPQVTLDFPTTPPPIDERGQPLGFHGLGDQMSPPKLLQHRRPLSTFPNTSNPSSPKSPAKSPKSRPSNIKVTPSLQVPAANIQPDSPGFANMLTAMTFPSPPKSSPSHSPASSVSNLSHISPSPTMPPVVQPRRSSSKARTTATSPAASLDEIVMRSSSNPTSRPGLNHLKSDSALHSSLATARSAVEPANPRHSEDRSTRSVSSASFVTARSERPVSTDTVVPEDALSNRDSSNSNITVTTDSYRQSGSTDCTFRQSTRSDMTAATALTSMSDEDSVSKTEEVSQVNEEDRPIPRTRTVSRHNRHKRSSATSSIFDMEKPIIASEEQAHLEMCKKAESERSETPSSICSGSTITISSEDLQGMSLKERRMARKAKVREYKQRDLAESRLSLKTNTPKAAPALADFDTVDSPVLGWFNPPRSRRSIQGPSPLANGSSSPTTPTQRGHSQTSSVGPSSRRSSVALLQTVPEADAAGERSTSETEQDKSDEEKESPQWEISSIVVEETVPEVTENDSDSIWRHHYQTPDLSMSPIMVVANLESKTGSTTLRPLSLLSPELTAMMGGPAPHPPPRSALRSKVRTQRPLPIKVGSSISPSAHERATNGRGTNRNSVPNLLTPPLSPELFDISPSRRMSLPARAHTLSNQVSAKSEDSSSPASDSTVTNNHTPPGSAVSAPTPGPDRTSMARRREMQARQQESRWLLAHQKEREQEWRITAVKERLRREKMEKDREIADMVTRTMEGRAPSSLASSPLPEEDEEEEITTLPLSARSFPRSRPGSSKSHNGGVDIELEVRLRKLEHNGDSWMRLMMPMLESMNRTLQEMQRDGMGSGLSMSEFVVDMDAEARRTSTYSVTNMPVTPVMVGNGRGGQGPMLEPLHEDEAIVSNEKDADVHISSASSIKSTSASTRGKTFTKDAASDKTIPTLSTDAPIACPDDDPTPTATQSSDPTNFSKDLPPLPLPSAPFASEANGSIGGSRPATPQEQQHEAEAQLAIQRRIDAQEAMMGELMKSWGGSSSSSTKKGAGSTTTPSSSASSIKTHKTQKSIVGSIAEEEQQKEMEEPLTPRKQSLAEAARAERRRNRARAASRSSTKSGISARNA